MALERQRDDFDRSFDYFGQSDGSQATDRTDPWSLSWINDNHGETSFDTEIFEFSAESSVQHTEDGDQDSQSHFFPADPFGGTRDLDKVRVAIHEQLSALYDDVATEPKCSVEGSIYVKSKAPLGGVPFCITVRDVLGQIGKIAPNTAVCKDVSEKVSRQNLHKLDKILCVRYPDNVLTGTEIQVATYSGTPSLRPVPLLVKTKVQVTEKYSRAGFKIRANPTNSCPMTKLVIVLAVPPYVQGETVKMSRQGGVWDYMKRTISWGVDKLEPGQALEVQLQFDSVDGHGGRTPKFPILVRADFHQLLSSVECRSDFSDGMSAQVKLKVHATARVIHRKV